MDPRHVAFAIAAGWFVGCHTLTGMDELRFTNEGEGGSTTTTTTTSSTTSTTGSAGSGGLAGGGGAGGAGGDVGGTGGTGGEGGAGGGCTTAGDCPDSSDPCEDRTCLPPDCGFEPIAAGDPAADWAQTAGDCTVLTCDVGGLPQPQEDSQDLPVDGNPCTQDLCTGTTPSNPPESEGTACGTDLECDGSGNCVPV